VLSVARECELSGRYPAELVEEMKTMGPSGMLIPDEYGGIGVDAMPTHRQGKGGDLQ
jgi:hypothetical protein